MLPYSTEARRFFDPVAAGCGLSCTSADEYEILYEDAQTFLSVCFDNGGTHELAVRCGLQTSPIQPASIFEIMRLAQDSPEAVKIDGMMAATASALSSCLRQLADITARYAPIAFSASDMWFEQLAKLRRKENRDCAVHSDLIAARSKADAAWKRKDFGGVVAALGPMRFYLSPGERKKLEYAARKCTVRPFRGGKRISGDPY